MLKASITDMRKGEMIVFGIVLLSFLAGAYFYPMMPERIASHWDAEGNVNGYMTKFWGLFLMPFISTGLSLLFVLIPKIDPLKANIEKFRKHYDRFVVLVMSFLFYLYLLTILWNTGTRFDMVQALVPAFGVLFYYCGILTEHARRNWYIGIRTPWTMSSEKVWAKTHKIGGKLFKVAGFVAFLGAVFPDIAIFFVIVPVLLVAAYTVVYSYAEYQKSH